MKPTIIIEAGAKDVCDPPRELLCSVWPVTQEDDQVAIGEPVFVNHLVPVGSASREKAARTLVLPQAGAYLVDIGYPNGQSLRTTVSVLDDQNHRLVVQIPKTAPVNSSNKDLGFAWVTRVVSAAPRRAAVRKMELEVAVAGQLDRISLSGLYEFCKDIRRSPQQDDKIFQCAVSTEMSHEVTLAAQSQSDTDGFEPFSGRKWLIVSGKGKPQTLVSYPYGWGCENNEPFKLMMARKSKEGRDAFKWSASLKLMDPVYGSLVEYLTRRDLSSSLSITESERGMATTALYKKIGNPFSAAAAAYLFALGATAEPQHQAWMERLNLKYSWMPDSAIALGWKTLREGQNDPSAWEAARDLFALAWSRGLPYYTVGLHLLVDALTLLSRFYPVDLLIREMLAAAKAADVACVRTEPFTTLQISRYLGLPMRSANGDDR